MPDDWDLKIGDLWTQNYKNEIMKYLVTGAAGFIGAKVSEELLKKVMTLLVLISSMIIMTLR